ncbi:MAG: hypothetical protein LBP53_07730 [Candidatus Peribacteria bacterium]|jgi:hypothetical protein|nr:hypothetical protein [Candidatus Peribacteria bacterium]
MQITGEVQTDVDGHYQIIGLEPGRYELQLFPLTGYDSVFSKGGKNLTAQAVGSGSLDGATDKDKIISIRGYAEDTISELDFGLDNTALTNVYTKIKLAGTQDEAVTLDVEYGNTTNINAKSVLLQIQLDPNVIYVNTSHPHAVYDSTQHKVSLSLGELTANQQHFSINVRLDTTALTGDTIRYHAFNFVSTISTATLPEITNLDNIASIDQRIITVGDIYGNVYEDKDKLLGRNPLRDEMLS